MSDTLKKITNIVEDHLTSTEINKVELCENEKDHYLLGKWDLAQQIHEVILTDHYNNILINGNKND